MGTVLAKSRGYHQANTACATRDKDNTPSDVEKTASGKFVHHYARRFKPQIQDTDSRMNRGQTHSHFGENARGQDKWRADSV